MGELILTPAGSIAGAAVLPNGISLFGQTISGAAIGQTVGRYVGRAIDDALLPPDEGARIKSLHIMESREGAALPIVYGRMRVGGQVIWAARFKEKRREDVAGKGGPNIVDYSYSVSFAVALCQGPISRIDRVWANGEPFSLRDVTWRLYPGTRDQLPDPLIEAIDGTGHAPAYRDTAYVVFEDLPLDAFGNRLPQLSFEVVRAGDRVTDPLATSVQGVNIIPATGEFVYATSIVRERRFPGIETTLNLNNARGDADFVVSLEQLRSDLPNVAQAALTVAWFGDDLRAGHCRLRPGVERRDRATVPYAWQVDQTQRQSAHLISQTEGSPNFGGTPADAAVLEGLAAMKAAGIAVTLSPFLLMDVPPGNGLPDPRGWVGQPAFPWRGRITVSQDKSANARSEIEAFVSEDGAFGFRHFILHHARLAVQAGGVEAFLIGSEMPALTRVRDAEGRFPFVEALKDIARDVRAIVGPDTKISYAADWTEYGAYAPGDGSRDVLFPLDDLWASEHVDFVGVDWYPPMGDWREGAAHLDAMAGYKSADDAAYLQSQIAGGEAYDWYYGSSADREAQIRRPIIDGASAEHWVFRAKDLYGWWAADHFPRPGGTRAAVSSAWQPGMKPVRLIEIGIPAVDKGANAPNVFVDPKSSESALPFFSTGARDDLIQRRALVAALSHWQAQDWIEQALVWAWDARPWPDFPAREDDWSDGPNWQFGHWLNGRTGLVEISDVVEDLAGAAAVEIEAGALQGVVDGYAVNGVTSLAAALAPLTLGYQFQFRESPLGLSAVQLTDEAIRDLSPDRVVSATQSETRQSLGQSPTGTQLSYISGDFTYQPALAQYRNPAADRELLARTALPLVLTSERAFDLAQTLYQALAVPDSLQVAFAPGESYALQIAEPVAFDGREWRVEALRDDGLVRRVDLRTVTPPIVPSRAVTVPGTDDAASYPAEIEFAIIDIANLMGTGLVGPTVAVSAAPWPGTLSVSVGATVQTLRERAIVRASARMGLLIADISNGPVDDWDMSAELKVYIPGGNLVSADAQAVSDGANRLALAKPTGWELIGWQTADLIGDDIWRLSGLLRGRQNTDAGAGSAGAIVVVIDDRLQTVPLDAQEVDATLHWQVGDLPIFTHRYSGP